MLPTKLTEALLRMSQLPKVEHRRADQTRKWARSSYLRAKALGKAGKRATDKRAPLRLPGTPRGR